MNNYVWRLEFQANGNVHYHIATDTYIDYFFAQKSWNAILSKHGYIQSYATRMQSLSYTDYLARYCSGSSAPADVLYKRYVTGKASGWSNPNTVDVKNAKSSDNIGYYISKYFSKKEKSAAKNNLDNETNGFAVRLCFWSRSLSRCKAESMPVDYFPCDFRKLLKNCDGAIEKVFDYCRVIYFDWHKLASWAKWALGAYFAQEMKENDYIPAT